MYDMKTAIFKGLLALGLFAFGQGGAAQYGMVNFKDVLEKSKLGKQKQASFESLKEQMEKVLEEKEKELNELASKINDPDYMDTLSPEAENELKHKLRALSQDMNEKQGQFYQALQNAQMKIMGEIAEQITQVSAKIAKEKKLDAIFNQDASFYWSDNLNVSPDIIKEMDIVLEQQAKEAPQGDQKADVKAGEKISETK
jgi:outer membrane protein